MSSFKSSWPRLPTGVPNQLDGLRQAADRRSRAGAIAGAFQADDKAQALQRVFFLAFDVADVFQRNARFGRSQATEAASDATVPRRNRELIFIDRIARISADGVSR